MSSQEISWSSPLKDLVSGRKSKTIDKLVKAGYHQVQDLLWIMPLRTQILPTIQSFEQAQDESLFRGLGKIIAVRDQPNFKAKGKGRTPLVNVTAVIQDRFSAGTLSLKWFNCYPSQVKAIKELDKILITGQISSFMGQLQIISPDYIELSEEEFQKDKRHWQENLTEEIKVTYPTVEGISPHHLAGLFEKIPEELWSQLDDSLPEQISTGRDLFPLGEAFRIVHGHCSKEKIQGEIKQKAISRLIYEEFFSEQVKIKIRRQHYKAKEGIKISNANWEKFLNLFPYSLTEDQKKSLIDIVQDLEKGEPMMRLIQGDVGSGKTSIALVAALMLVESGYQCAIMCPTESLALQHFLTFQSLLSEKTSLDYLVGSLTKKEKDGVLSNLKSGETQLVIGTHALIQDTVEFKNLGLAIIDEQHKFGVEQRVKLIKKGEGVHCLLLTATPIPRSLSLTQYGDLEISLVKSMPSNRKGTKTRIVTPETYAKFLSFLKTRIEMGEQAYVVVPAIEENPEQDMLNLETVLKKYKEYFPDLNIVGLHGRMKANEKNEAFVNFREKNIDILISTSVIEVGIDNPNASIMTILNPERFGLSSLHQMRGRVGRGEKPGFCFLVNDKRVSQNSMERLRIIENNIDGFKIAEEDLRIRGEGDLFGKDQSGVKSSRILASLIEHQETLEMAREDVELIERDYPQVFKQLVDKFSENDFVLKTV